MAEVKNSGCSCQSRSSGCSCNSRTSRTVSTPKVETRPESDVIIKDDNKKGV